MTNDNRSREEGSTQWTSSTISSTGCLAANPASTRYIASNSCSRSPGRRGSDPATGHSAPSAARNAGSSPASTSGSSITDRSAATIGAKASSPSASGRHSPASTARPAARPRDSSRAISRLFPMPASPSTNTAEPAPVPARASTASSAASSEQRPTNTGDEIRRTTTVDTLTQTPAGIQAADTGQTAHRPAPGGG